MIDTNRATFGVISKPSGQMGNHLFQKLFLARLAKESKLNEFHRAFAGNHYLTNLNRKGISIATFNRPRVNLSREYLAESSLNDLTRRLHEIYRENMYAIIPSGIMDNHFFNLPVVAPTDLFKWKKVPKSAWEGGTTGGMRIALHFRGRDFQEWEPKAILSSAYYLNSLEQVQSDHQSAVILFTDDPSHEIVLDLKSKIPQLSVESGDPIFDFYSMSTCDVLISSPSSFCFWGGALGKPKQILHSKEWLDFKCDQGDYFWSGLRENKFLGYRINQEI